jgi:hypothetical protein
VQSMPDAGKAASRTYNKHKQLSGPSEDDNDTGATSGTKLPGKLLFALLVPFLPVYVYALYHLFAGVVLLVYLIVLFLYFLIVAAFVVAEISICPPWYTHSSPKQGLTKHGLPDYWQGFVTDPKTEFGFKYEVGRGVFCLVCFDRFFSQECGVCEQRRYDFARVVGAGFRRAERHRRGLLPRRRKRQVQRRRTFCCF